ncbi:unnamed protein product [Acanthoscelides obtectus]|uniref:THAP-type domain-containing protein n=1 Tax=Acanthoscelides obtectus TaxID=200917 RepID=A0A9P0K560_ACAOB|nr:unnamed protein product [Acanthoscelides obtectus]CAK1640369.1 THAP domain-containing protein 4 [Acanthoscelides obtectus]
MGSCALRSCASRTEVDENNTTEKTFHRLPKNADRCQLWVKFVNRGEWTPTRSSVICSKHFSEESFDRTSKCYVNLKLNDVPTIHLNQEESPPSTIKY